MSHSEEGSAGSVHSGLHCMWLDQAPPVLACPGGPQLPGAGSHEYVQPVEALLEVAAFPDDGICAMTFNFWHRLSCDLTSSFSPASALHQANGSHQACPPTFQQMVQA